MDTPETTKRRQGGALQGLECACLLALGRAVVRFAGNGDGKQRVAIFFDGKPHPSEAGNDDAATVPRKEGQIELLFNMHLRHGTVAFDNLKVWNYAKTGFSDRNEE